MAQDPDSANPFAIPDFWKASPWLETTLDEGNSLFSFDTSRMYFLPLLWSWKLTSVQENQTLLLSMLTVRNPSSPRTTMVVFSVSPLFSRP